GRVGKALREHLMVRGCCGLGRETVRARSVLLGPRVRGKVVVDERRQRTGGQVLQRPLENGVSRRIITYATVPRGDLEIVLRVRAREQRRSRGFSSVRGAAQRGLRRASLCASQSPPSFRQSE